MPATPETIAAGEQYLKMQARRSSAAQCGRRRLGDARRSIAPAWRDDVAWFVPHQANLRIIEAAANGSGSRRSGRS